MNSKNGTKERPVSLSSDDLVLFARVVETGSFSRAAARCGLPKSTLSRRISGLEQVLGERLLVRSTRRLAITEFGEGILEHARRLAEETDAAGALALHRQVTPRGTLRVSFPPDFLELDLTPFLAQYTQRYPDVRLELDLSARRVDLLAERIDLAIRVAGALPDDSTLVARQIVPLHSGLYASPDYLARRGLPATPADLAAHTGLALIASNGETVPWRLQHQTARWEGQPVGPLASNSIGLQRTLALQGMGIAAISTRYAAPLVAQGVLRRVLPDWQLPTLYVWCVTPGRRLLPTRTTAFVELLRDWLRSCPAEGT